MKRTVVGILSVSVALITLVAPSAGAGGKAKSITDATVDCSAGTSCTVEWSPPVDASVTGSTTPEFEETLPVVEGRNGATVVNGLDASKRYYFEVVPAGAKRGLVVAERSLRLESAPNARDIGGYETRDGHRVKWGTVFRSDAISETTPADDARLANLGIKSVCDFRGPGEVEADGPDKVPPGAEVVPLPVLDEKSNQLADDIRAAVTGGDKAAIQELLGDGKAEQLLVDGGKFFVTSDTATEQFGALLERLADPAALPTLTHCTAGKDRTGWSTAVILTALGVPKKTVMSDYLLTNEYAAEGNEKNLQAIETLTGLSDLVRPVLEVRPEYLNASFAAVKQKYGTFASYLRKGLGVDARTLAALKENLLT